MALFSSVKDPTMKGGTIASQPKSLVGGRDAYRADRYVLSEIPSGNTDFGPDPALLCPERDGDGGTASDVSGPFQLGGRLGPVRLADTLDQG